MQPQDDNAEYSLLDEEEVEENCEAERSDCKVCSDCSE